jgi:hypothetical protein
MWRRRFSLRFLFVLVAIIAVTLAVQDAHDDWYVRTYSSYHLWSLLRDRIRHGDSKEEIARHFDEMRQPNERDMDHVRKIWLSRRGWTIEPGDEFIHFGTKAGTGVFFQFRDGKLMNHQPSDYADLALLARMNKANYPSWLVRHSSFITAGASALLCVLMWVVMTGPVLRRWFFRIAFMILTVTTLLFACYAGGFFLAVACIGWGILFARATRLGIESTPAANWHRRTSPFQSFLVYAVLLAVIFVHATLALVTIGGVGALCAAWLIVAAMMLTFRLLDSRLQIRAPQSPTVSV